jgi:hypothetical protein
MGKLQRGPSLPAQRNHLPSPHKPEIHFQEIDVLLFERPARIDVLSSWLKTRPYAVATS